MQAKNHILIIAGVPGIGKTTLALSAPDPLLINTDDNYHKVKIAHRVAPHITPQDYDEVKRDLENEDLSTYKTLIFDTAGTLVEIMKLWVAKKSINTLKDGVTLSLKGYGALKEEFSRLMNFCRYQLKKHIILIFHTNEKKEEDGIIYRLDIAGSSGDFAWKIADLGGFYFTESGNRIINFSPTQYYHAKNAYGITGTREIPYTHSASDNTFLTDIFNEAEKNQKEEEKLITEYTNLMDNIRSIIDQVQDVDGANDVCETFTKITWVFAAKKEAWALLNQHCKPLGIVYSRENKKFVYDQREDIPV